MPIPNLGPGTGLRLAVEEMATGQLTYLLGAGASVSAGLPAWGELLRRLLADRGLEPDSIGKLLESQDNLLVAEAAFARTATRAKRERSIFKALYGSMDVNVASREFTPSSLHLAVAADAVRRGNHDVTLLTLNYDDLQEEALVKELTKRRFKDPVERVHGRSDATHRANSRQFEVHHLHGLLPRESQSAIGDRLILTLSDYSRLLSDSWQRTQVLEAVQHGPTLMLGTSYSDPDIRNWLGSLRPENRRKLLAVMSRPAFGLSRGQMAKVSSVVAAQWESVGVQVLVVDDYATPTQIVREVGAVTRDDYVPPSARVGAVLGRRIDDFEASQVGDADTLERQLKRFASTLGNSAALTLWLHDGQESLVRWAASDRTYRTPKLLRRIDVDPDSGWIAARSVCNDTEVIRDIDVRTAELTGELGVPPRGTTTGRWVMVGARPLVAVLPGGPAVTVGALSVASPLPKAEVDIASLQSALDVCCREWERRLEQT